MANIYKFRQWSLTLLRLALGLIFTYHGYLKLFAPGGFSGTIGFFAAIGIPIPAFSAFLVSVVEFAGGLFLIAGFFSKWASVALIINMLVAIFKVHIKNGFLIANGGIEFALALLISLLVILMNGPGSLSLERAIFEQEEKYEASPESKKSPRKSGKKLKVKDADEN